MRSLKYILGITLIVFTTTLLLWPYIKTDFIPEIMNVLMYFRSLHENNPGVSYLAFALVFSMIIMFSLPLDSAFMIIAGFTYSFWEGAVLVTICRFMMAVGMFHMGRRMIKNSVLNDTPKLIKKFEKHPYLGVFILRLAPLPESFVNYGMSTTSIKVPHYALASIIGIIPLSIICAWMGSQLGSINEIINIIA